jgi:predicted nucleotidyltransferase component of viral defense system
MLSERETVELFHLHFLRLLAGGRDKSRFVLKGGCNLRFFFGSVRYSEDLDLNASGIALGALKDRVDGCSPRSLP